MCIMERAKLRWKRDEHYTSACQLLGKCVCMCGEVTRVLFRKRGFSRRADGRAYSCSAEALGKWWAGVARALGGGRIMEILGGECCRVLALVRVCNIPSFGTRHLLGAHVYAKAQILAYTKCENYSNHPSSSICTRAQPLDTRSRPAYFIKHYN